jgi:hypothetical protein
LSLVLDTAVDYGQEQEHCARAAFSKPKNSRPLVRRYQFKFQFQFQFLAHQAVLHETRRTRKLHARGCAVTLLQRRVHAHPHK